MIYNEMLANRVRELLADQQQVEEKKMFRGICFMVNEKMCVGANAGELMCRIGAEQASLEAEKGNCRQMVHNGRVMKDFVFVEETLLRSKEELSYWVKLALRFNKDAKASGKKNKR